MKRTLTALAFGCFIFAFVAIAETSPVKDVKYDALKEEKNPELTAGYFEGDMEVVQLRNGMIEPAKRWPNRIVFYKIDHDDFDEEHINFIERAIASIEQVSCLRFSAATSKTKAYIDIVDESSGCHSKLGYTGEVQKLTLQVNKIGQGCFRLGTVQHELLHALGFFHQQNSPVRDSYLKVLWDNIKKDYVFNFQKYSDKLVTEYGAPYDYGSVMHYGTKSFTKNGKQTLIPVIGNSIKIGQRDGLSQIDIFKLNKMYECPDKDE